jgi:two-component system, OmpR family, sensor histidine kinase BaeS
MNPRRARSSLAARLFAAQLLVIVAGSVTLAVVALWVAPGVFRAHARQALTVLSPATVDHLERGFGDALLLALAVATVGAVVTALAATWLLAQRLTQPIRALARAADRIGQGSYQVRVPVTAPGDELATLGNAFNRMADALASTERRRQELLADLAHELRTPLATLEGYVEGLTDGVVAADEQAWAVLQAEIARLRRLAEDLTAVSRAEEQRLDLRRSPVDPGALVSAAVQAARPSFAAKGVALRATVEDRPPTVAVDADRIAEVLANLLGNALRHTPAGGRVEVTVRRQGEELELAVTDTGEGIPPELLGRVFERFYRADPARARDGGGSGIGLTITRAIVHAHGGRVWAESAGRGRGTRLVIRLPRAAPGPSNALEHER